MLNTPNQQSALTADEVAAMRERCEKATPGPWHMNGDGFARRGDYHCPTVYATDSELRYIAFCNDRMNIERTDNGANADFIAHARTDLPRLLDAHEGLRVENEGLRERVTALEGVVREMAEALYIPGKPERDHWEWKCRMCCADGRVRSEIAHTASCPMNNPIVRELVGGE